MRLSFDWLTRTVRVMACDKCALVTPTREQIAEVINANADIHDGIDIYATADAVLALMRGASGDGHQTHLV